MSSLTLKTEDMTEQLLLNKIQEDKAINLIVQDSYTGFYCSNSRAIYINLKRKVYKFKLQVYKDESQIKNARTFVYLITFIYEGDDFRKVNYPIELKKVQPVIMRSLQQKLNYTEGVIGKIRCKYNYKPRVIDLLEYSKNINNLSFYKIDNIGKTIPDFYCFTDYIELYEKLTKIQPKLCIIGNKCRLKSPIGVVYKVEDKFYMQSYNEIQTIKTTSYSPTVYHITEHGLVQLNLDEKSVPFIFSMQTFFYFINKRRVI